MIIMIRECTDTTHTVLAVSTAPFTVIEAADSDSLVTLAEAVILPTWGEGQHPTIRISMI